MEPKKPHSIMPLLYVGSYVALVIPQGKFVHDPNGNKLMSAGRNGVQFDFFGRAEYYRFAASACKRVFWPLEQLDRRLRPQSWDDYPDPVEFQLLFADDELLILHPYPAEEEQEMR